MGSGCCPDAHLLDPGLTISTVSRVEQIDPVISLQATAASHSNA